MTREAARLAQHYDKQENWLKWGPYLSERQWGTVREDYSRDGSAWDYVSHDMARSKAYKWGKMVLQASVMKNSCSAPASPSGTAKTPY
ncbi:hypothetical protein MKQ70_04500 [Chitinophaga sedimenti]|uniref:hypothetical protein n=1 Tax=Chitinophaga sedimenti TaxID=2033606 RepID=UPI0020052B82|nr:hypothetical protein [Chitinophaga sedimenti]MCK7554309.1 hypothetical protein [Chitinophaga sedimenti]